VSFGLVCSYVSSFLFMFCVVGSSCVQFCAIISRVIGSEDRLPP